MRAYRLLTVSEVFDGAEDQLRIDLGHDGWACRP